MTSPAGQDSAPRPFEPLQARRVVTGIDASGHSVLISDGPAPSILGGDGASGMQVIEMWQTTVTPPDLSGEDLSNLPHALEPVAGGLHWRLVVFPERDAPGFMHRTDTLDMLYIVSGQVILEVGDDPDAMQAVQVQAGDAVVALANVHRWRNPGPGPCVLVASMASALELPSDT